ncbi:MAG: hypothetical protein EAZ30_05230 [Betaproteobacteria bacterium]|nr:MAG: hypothetical protein EAZ43_01180 [Betaproteobacteria bacterium]TAG48575.1 MAG: hypothetical protein EAZ30_05230 [Betaproteobacteria bacterium]
MAGDPLTEAAFETLCNETRVERFDLYNQLATYDAQADLSGECGFELGDNVMRSLWGLSGSSAICAGRIRSVRRGRAPSLERHAWN